MTQAWQSAPLLVRPYTVLLSACIALITLLMLAPMFAESDHIDLAGKYATLVLPAIMIWSLVFSVLNHLKALRRQPQLIAIPLALQHATLLGLILIYGVIAISSGFVLVVAGLNAALVWAGTLLTCHLLTALTYRFATATGLVVPVLVIGVAALAIWVTDEPSGKLVGLAGSEVVGWQFDELSTPLLFAVSMIISVVVVSAHRTLVRQFNRYEPLALNTITLPSIDLSSSHLIVLNPLLRNAIWPTAPKGSSEDLSNSVLLTCAVLASGLWLWGLVIKDPFIAAWPLLILFAALLAFTVKMPSKATQISKVWQLTGMPRRKIHQQLALSVIALMLLPILTASINNLTIGLPPELGLAKVVFAASLLTVISFIAPVLRPKQSSAIFDSTLLESTLQLACIALLLVIWLLVQPPLWLAICCALLAPLSATIWTRHMARSAL